MKLTQIQIVFFILVALITGLTTFGYSQTSDTLKIKNGVTLSEPSVKVDSKNQKVETNNQNNTDTFKNFQRNFKFIIEILMAIIMIIALFLLFNNLGRRNQGIGENVIQFTSIALIIPAIVILGLEEVIQKETVATLLSGLGGYGLSSATTGRKTSPPNNDKANSLISDK